jgi:hypothetical protein
MAKGRPASFAPDCRILERRSCSGAEDLVDRYRVVDLNRRMHFKMHEAYEFLDNCVVSPIACSLEVYQVDNFWACPEVPGWPGWTHVGNHVGIGEKFYSFMKTVMPVKKLHFSDSPDFHGEFKGKTLEGLTPRFFGDIGTVSFGAFLESWTNMRMGDYWISVLGNGDVHLIIQKCYTRRPHVRDDSAYFMTNSLTYSIIDGSEPRSADSLWWENGKPQIEPSEVAA